MMWGYGHDDHLASCYRRACRWCDLVRTVAIVFRLQLPRPSSGVDIVEERYARGVIRISKPHQTLSTGLLSFASSRFRSFRRLIKFSGVKRLLQYPIDRSALTTVYPSVVLTRHHRDVG